MMLADLVASQPRLAQRAIAIALVPIAAFIVWIALFTPARWVVTSQAEWREQARGELARARGQAAALSALKKQAAAFPSAPIWQRLYTASGDSVGSSVQQDIARISTSAGLESQSISLLPGEKAGALFRHTVRLSVTGTADRFKTFLSLVREHTRYLRVEAISVGAPHVQRGDQNPLLTVTMEIVAFESDVSSTPEPRT
jgi:Tfp pilus assembly protein PilO